jgi:SpoIID/LytB domain protein
MKIRAYSESGAWEVHSPDDVTWKVTVEKTIRPAMAVYFATVKNHLSNFDHARPNQEIQRWKRRGFPSTRWVSASGPSKFGRWFISLTPPTSKQTTETICAQVRKNWKTSCQVVGRVDLPPLVAGTLIAENSNFSRRFEGFLELFSPRGPVEVLDVVPEERTKESTRERYGSKLYVIPDLDTALNFIQSVELKKYLEGVVPSEIFPAAPKDALRAQTIVARTYAIRYFKPDDLIKPYQICGSTMCQVYKGEVTSSSTISDVVQESKDLVLWESSGELAETFYHAICGGQTEPRHEVLGSTKKNYLLGTSDQVKNTRVLPLSRDLDVEEYLRRPATSYCGVSSFSRADRWRWESSLDRSALDNVAREAGLEPPLKDIRARLRGKSGRILRLDIVSSKGSESVEGELRIRRLLGGLLSSLFVLEAEKNARDELERVRIRGGAYGHGVGLCQMGAIGRAEAGQSFREILSAYYPGTILAPLSRSGLP